MMKKSLIHGSAVLAGAIAGLFVMVNAGATVAAEPAAIRVMTYNLWHGGDAGKQPLERTIAVIEKAGADIVGLQETHGFGPAGQPRPDRAKEIAARLGWHYLDQGERTGIVSRFKIVESTPRKWGAKLEFARGQHVYLFNAHLMYTPYQPYQLLSIPYNNAPFLKTAEEAVQSAKKTRGGQVERMLAEIQAIRNEGTPIFVTGDFNEPSHLDWTVAAADKKLCPLPVEWPTTKAVVDAGFEDAYRSVYPDPVKHPGLTWTPITKPTDPKDRHDRIDFVFVRGLGCRVKSVQVVGESEQNADIVLESYPSDHRAVVAEVELPPQ